MTDYNSTNLFIKVCDYGSFSKTAEQIDTPVSTISRKIRQLEKDLGVRLLERSTRKLRLTEAGSDYYNHCHRAITEIEKANFLMGNHTKEVSGMLRISIPPSLDKCLVLPLVMEFQALYPQANISLRINEKNINFYEQNIDLAFRVGKLEDSSVIARQLLCYRHVLVASPQYLVKNGTPGQPVDLTSHRLIGFADDIQALNWRFEHKGRQERLSITPYLTINDHSDKQIAAELGYGITDLPSIICQAAISSGHLVEVLPRWRLSTLSTSEVPLSIVYPSNRNQTKLTNVFIDFCCKRTKQEKLLLMTEHVGRISEA